MEQSIAATLGEIYARLRKIGRQAPSRGDQHKEAAGEGKSLAAQLEQGPGESHTDRQRSTTSEAA